MIPSSAIQVVEQTPTRLVILDPPYYLVGGLILLVGLVGALQFGRAFTGGKQVLVSPWLTLLLVSPFVLVGLGLLTSRTVVTLSRDLGNATVDRRIFGLPWLKKEVPLADLRNAEIQRGHRQTKRLALVLRNGSKIGLGAFTNVGGGQEQAAAAINAFLRGR